MNIKLLSKLTNYIKKIVNIDDSDIKSFASNATLRTFKKKEVFVSEGQQCHELLFIHEGLFRYYYVLEDGQDLTKDFAIETDNAFCTAYASFITGQLSMIWIEALEDSTVWVWQKDYVSDLFQRSPWIEFAKNMVDMIYLRKEKREYSFLLLTPEQRYHQFLKEFPQLNQRVPQYQIASYLGLTPESLSRIRKRKLH